MVYAKYVRVCLICIDRRAVSLMDSIL